MDHFKAFFNFSKKEMDGLLVLGVLIVLVISFPYAYQWIKPVESFDFMQFRNEIERFRASEYLILGRRYPSGSFMYRNSTSRPKVRYFNFNPNNLPEQQWRELGLNEYQLKVIRNFESKGGHFYRKEDLKKIFSITAEDYAKLEPFIVIPRKAENRAHLESLSEKVSLKPVLVIELNQADSIQLESVRGIGPAFASRIIKYRTRLGGFHSIEQLKEVYGIDSTRYQSFKNQFVVNALAIKKIRINSAEFDELKQIPYLSYKQVNAIIQYRKQHGNYVVADDLKKVTLIDDAIIRKIAPYLAF